MEKMMRILMMKFLCCTSNNILVKRNINYLTAVKTVTTQQKCIESHLIVTAEANDAELLATADFVLAKKARSASR